MQEFEYGKLDENSSPFKKDFRLALLDIGKGIRSITIWSVLGWQDIKQRYRRSVLGPFWLTISTAIMVAALGFLYANLLGQDVAEFIPHVGVGLIIWTFLSTLVLEAATVFTSSEGMIKQIRMPLTVHVCRMVWRNVMIFAHNSLILICMLYLTPEINVLDLLTIPFAVLLMALNGLWIGLVLGVVCTRFRDVSQILINFVQVLFFITPVFWKPELLADRAWIADYNPAYHFIELVRSPIVGAGIPEHSWMVTSMMTLGGFIAAIIVLAKYRSRVAYWL